MMIYLDMEEEQCQLAGLGKAGMNKAGMGKAALEAGTGKVGLVCMLDPVAVLGRVAVEWGRLQTAA